MQINGTIRVINPEQQVSASFRKRELVVTTAEQYPQHILIEFGQDKCDLLNSYKIGDNVQVSINLRGREWVNPQGETKYFNSIQGWRIEKVAETDLVKDIPVHEAEIIAPSSQAQVVEDDLPF